MSRNALPPISPTSPPTRFPSVSRVLAGAFALSALVLGSRASNADVASPKSDPSLPTLTEPAQTQSPTVYRARREALMKEMGEGVAVIYGEGAEDGDGYRPNTDFFYLTGVVEEGAILVLAPKERTYREFLLLASRDPEAERWTGEREPLGPALRARYGFEKISRTGRLMGLMFELAGRWPVLWQVSRPGTEYSSEKPKDLDLYHTLGEKLPEVSIRSLGWTLDRMRSRHSDEELAIMQRTIRISEEGFRAARGAIRPGAFEGAVEAEAERVWKANGELLLMDISAEFAHYASDITRTVPVNGKFTPEQRKVYEVVIAAQQAAFELLKPGAYYEPLQAGMVITLEPGIYIPEKGIGVRIEDDALVTATGARYLSDGIPRGADDVERWMAGQ